MKYSLKIFLTTLLLMFAVVTNAQIKVHPDSHVSIGTLSDSWNIGTHIYQEGWAVFNTQTTTPWHIVTLATPGAVKGKCWVVTAPGNKSSHKFYVTGDGLVYKCGTYSMSDRSIQSETEPIDNAGETLDQITGIWYNPTELEERGESRDNTIRCAGVCAQEVEKVLPEAVTTDDSGLLYVNYETLTVFLLEAVKEQRQEIQEMRKILEENGLIK